MLAAALVKRYGRGAAKFVAQQVIESDDANRATWLAVMEALPIERVPALDKVLEDN